MRKFCIIFMSFLLILSMLPNYVKFSFAAETIDTIIKNPEIKNSDFEIPATIPGWNLVTSNEVSEVAIRSNHAFSGENSLYFNNSSNEEQLQITSNLIRIESNQAYVAQAQVYVIEQSHSIGYEVHFFDEQENKIGTPVFVNNAKGSLEKDTWNTIETPFHVPEEATFIQLRFNSGKVAITEAYFDDVKVLDENKESATDINNFDFEDQTTIPGWELVTQNEVSSIALSNEQKTSGTNSLYFNNSSNEEQLQVTSDKIAVTPNEKYSAQASVYVVKQSHSIGYEIHFFAEDGTKVGNATFVNHPKDSLTENDWNTIETPFEVPSNVTHVQLRFNSGKIAITEAYFDDVSIKHVSNDDENNEEPDEETDPPTSDEYAKQIINPSFEDEVVQDVIPGWKSEFTGPGIAVSQDISRTGNNSLHLHDESDKDSVSVISDKIEVIPGESYLTTVYAYVISQTHNIVTEVRFYDANDNKVGEKRELNGNLPKEKWIDLKLFSDVPKTAAYARIALYSGGISLTEVYFDDVSFERVEEDKPLDRNYLPFENLGDMVHVQLGQAGVIQVNSLGESEVYYHSNGLPGTFSVLDAETGELKFSQVIQNTEAMWAMTVGPDKNVYFAGTADGMLYRYVPEKKAVESLGKNPSDNWVWDLEASSDGKIYGTTYPNASLFEYDIQTNTFKDFGSLSAEDYARGLAINGDNIYVGIGTVRHLIKVNRHTGEKEEIHLEGYTGETGTIEKVYFVNNKMFVSVSTINMIVVDLDTMDIVDIFQYSNKISPVDPNNPNVFYYKFEDNLYKYDTNTLKSTVIENIPLLPDTVRVKDMQWITLQSGETVLAIITQYGEFMYFDPKTNTVNFTLLDLAASAVAIQSLETGPDGNLYMGGYQRGMSVYNPFSNDIEVNISSFAQPEGIGFLNGVAYFGTYVDAIIYRYDHKKATDLNTNPAFAYDIADQQDRPFAITSGANKLFVGTVPDYGVLGGALAIYDAKSDTWTQERNIVEDQSIISLVHHDGKLYGGTSVWGGLGIEPVADEAKIFVWDVATGKKIQEFTPEIPNIDKTPKMIGDLSIGPDGDLWGAIDGTIFALDIDTLEVVKSKMIRPSLYNSSKWFPYRLKWAPDGMLYTTLSRQLIAIDPDTLQYKVLDDEFMNSMTVSVDGSIYYAIGTELRKIAIPETDATLTSIKVNGKSVEAFSPGELTYTVVSESESIETIDAITTQNDAAVTVNITGSTATITVVGTDNVSTLTYTVELVNNEDPGESENPEEPSDSTDTETPDNSEESNESDNNDEPENENKHEEPVDGDSDPENQNDSTATENPSVTNHLDETVKQTDNLLPKTATNLYTIILFGCMIIFIGMALFFIRKKQM